jgi:lipid-A-disaccharide synthase
MKYYIIAGEASGDLHGSNLIKALQKESPEIDIRFWGGDLMSALAGEPVKHIKDLAFMGFIEVIANLRTILKNISFCKADILAYQPDALILIDYPGFNMRIAEFAKETKIPVHYYISPQIWAWKQNRVHKIKKFVDEMYCILPFEKDFYAKFGREVHYVGHPLVDAIQHFKKTATDPSSFRAEFGLSDKKLLALLPGSRLQEIKLKLPIMLEAAKRFTGMEIVVAGAPNIPEEYYRKLAKDISIKVISNRTYDILNQAHLGMVTSGTATLETALFKVPQVVCYKGNPISVMIARRLIKVPYISLVNLIMNKEVVKELIQKDLTTTAICDQLSELNVGQKRDRLMHEYDSLEQLLGDGGASEKIAHLILASTARQVN